MHCILYCGAFEEAEFFLVGGVESVQHAAMTEEILKNNNL
jgi:hypothetical protein